MEVVFSPGGVLEGGGEVGLGVFAEGRGGGGEVVKGEEVWRETRGVVGVDGVAVGVRADRNGIVVGIGEGEVAVVGVGFVKAREGDVDGGGAAVCGEGAGGGRRGVGGEEVGGRERRRIGAEEGAQPGPAGGEGACVGGGG